MSTPNETRVTVTKLDAKKQIAYGAVYVPYVPDSQGDFMTPEEIERVAHGFLKKGAVNAIDTEHNLQRNGSVVVESFVSREGDPDFPVPGTWVLGVHIPDKDHWAKAERGEIGGFSMYGTGRRVQRLVEIEVPDDGVLFGKTEVSGSMGTHEHMYALDFDTKGNFLGGETDEVNGHTHKIVKGTVTEPGPDGHRHRFSFVDTLAKGCGPATPKQRMWQRKRRALRKAAWNEEAHPRGKTTPESNEGSFAPKGTASVSDGGPERGGGGGLSQARDAWRDVTYPAGTMGHSTQGRGLGEVYTDDTEFEAEMQRREALFAKARQAFPDMLAITMDRFNTIWHTYEGNPEGGGFGTTDRGSQKKVAQMLIDRVPPGRPYMLLVNGKGYEGGGVRIKKSDVSADDMPEPVAEQDERTCKDCRTPKACKKAGRCLIRYEDEENEESEA